MILHKKKLVYPKLYAKKMNQTANIFDEPDQMIAVNWEFFPTLRIKECRRKLNGSDTLRIEYLTEAGRDQHIKQKAAISQLLKDPDRPKNSAKKLAYYLDGFYPNWAFVY